MELEMDCLTSRRLFKLKMSVLCTKVWAFSKAGVSSSYDGWAKCEEKVPDVSDPNQNLKTRSHSKLKFT